MDVELYVYDLSRGMARSMSAALLGVQIDAVYHTAIILQGIEYVYDGGIKTVQPGMTHLGRPMQVVPLGKTELPMEIIIEYLDSLRTIYTAEAYDLWSHNCNNFSNDFATFLLGKGIPSHITNLPQTVLNTPFGRMLQPQINDMMKGSRQRHEGVLGIADNAPVRNVPENAVQHAARVKYPTTAKELDVLLTSAANSCAIIFFTSQTCAPCKSLYPLYDELAAEAGTRAVVIKVDTNRSFDISSRYQIRSTPTFISFLRGQQENKWSGGGPSTLRGNFNLLLQMAWPPHAHESLRLPSLRGANTKPVLYGKVPPLDKLLSKMGDSAKSSAIQGLKKFIGDRESSGAAAATLPDLNGLGSFLRHAAIKLQPDILFPVIDLVRVALSDPRVSGYYAEEKDHVTMSTILQHVNGLQDCPYPLRLVALQMACNTFSSPLYPQSILKCDNLRNPIVQLITTSLLDDKHHNVRVAAASLTFNIAVANWKLRTEQHHDDLPEGDQVELAASLLEAIGVEEDSPETLKGYLLALGYLIFCVPKQSELVDLLKTMDAHSTVLSKKNTFKDERLIQEVGNELLGKGL